MSNPHRMATGPDFGDTALRQRQHEEAHPALTPARAKAAGAKAARKATAPKRATKTAPKGAATVTEVKGDG